MTRKPDGKVRGGEEWGVKGLKEGKTDGRGRRREDLRLLDLPVTRFTFIVLS